MGNPGFAVGQASAKRLAAGSRLRILVLGYIVRGPIGGLAWHHLQYVIGLTELGHDVYFFEDSDDYPSCYDPRKSEPTTDPAYGIDFARKAFARVNLGDRWAYYDAHGCRWLGPCAGRALDLFATAELLINLSAINPLRPWSADVPIRVLVDTDPVFTQIRHLSDREAHENALEHTAFFTFGENIGRRGCTIPDDGFPWQPTRQPVTLSMWPVSHGPRDGKFTTVMQWNSYPAREYGGRHYGMKAESFRDFEDLPTQVGPVFELAVANGPRARLSGKGWLFRDPLEVTRDPWVYQSYIRASKAEFGIAKHGYVASGSGWFSERSAAYLASGRPVLAQDTAFSVWLPTGLGVVPFETADDAVRGVEDIQARYRCHCAAAREFVAAYFDSKVVLFSLIERSQARVEAAP